MKKARGRPPSKTVIRVPMPVIVQKKLDKAAASRGVARWRMISDAIDAWEKANA